MTEKVRVKLSHPSSWFNHGHWSYTNHFPGLNPVWNDFYFEINNDKMMDCDVWVIHESLDKAETINCPPENVVLVISEEKQQVFTYDPEYLKQFALIVTTREDIVHPNVLRTFNLNPWRIRRTYDQIINARPQKSDEFSVVVSNNVSTSGHLKRYAFANRLKGHFKDRMTWFGKGENEVDDKWEALQSNKYSLAMENCSVPYYFTEKIMDCFCATTMPIYWGCKNIFDYFPQEAIVLIDADDYKGSIEIIEKAMAENRFENNYNAILQAKDLVLNKYQFIPAITSIINSKIDLSVKSKKKISIKPKNQKRFNMLTEGRRLKNYLLNK